MSRVALVTGGASGIGLGCGRRLAADGNRVALLDRDAAAAEAAAAELAGEGFDVVAVGADVSDRAAIDAAVATVRDRLGPIGIVVASAGIEAFEPVLDITTDSWDRVISVNLSGVFHSVQAVVADMLEASWGRIVTIASTSALSGAPRMAHYAASKGGVISLTKALAVELARQGITANAIAPSLVDTPMARKAEAEGTFIGVDVVAPMVPMGRAGTPDDIAAAVSYLCSDGAAYTTGQVLGVNGGMRI